MRVYKSSGIEWLGEIPQSWEVVKGAFVFSNKKELNSKLQCQERLALTLNGVVEKDINQNDGLNPMDFSTYQIFEKNDLVFKLIDLDNVNTSRVGYVYKKGIMSSAYIRLIIGEKSYAKFFYYYYFSLYINQVFNNLGTGVRATLNADELLAIKIPLPPLQEQKEIAEFLDKKCEKIQNYINKKQKLITLLQEKKQALINEAVTKGLNPNIEFKNSGIEYLGLIPHHWEVTKFKYFYRSNMGETILTQDLETDGIPVYSATEEDKFFGKIKNPVNILNINDFVIPARGNSIGAIKIVKEKSTCTQTTIFSKQFKDINPYYVYYFLLGYRKFLFEFIQTAIPQITISQVNENPIIFPPLQEQKEIAEFLDSKVAQINSAIEKTKKQIELVREYKNTLINEAVCGRIKLKKVK